MSTELAQHVFAALADPTRRLFIEKLSAEGAKTATELARDVPISRQGVSKHLRILAKAELVTIQQVGREKQYLLTPKPLDETVSWVTAVSQQWDNRLKALFDYLANEENAK